MPLFETIPIDESEVKQIVKENWSLDLGKCLKVSQNHVYLAQSSDETKFIVRVIPDPHLKRQNDIEVEVALLDFLKDNDLPVCKAIPTQSLPSRKWITTKSNVIIVVFEHAKGEPVVLTDWKWMTSQEQVVGLGRWFSKLHPLTQRFAKEFPHLVPRRWTELHDRVLAEAPIDKRDMDTITDPSKFGIVHGDVNISNFFWDSSIGMPQMFDWDQVQQCWFLYDLASPIWTVVTMKNGGNPIDQSPVPNADVKQYTEWLVSGYEEGGAKVDREALQRMLELRRQLYKRFCKRAVEELAPEAPMYKFCQYMNSWLDKDI